MQKNIRNIAILAHVDAGKTTLTENFLFAGGATRKLGNVDNGSAVSDSLDVEKKRGISVRSANISFMWNDNQINLIDTPGHIDFSAEVERILGILDGAILVISAVEGLQAHTYTLWEALQELNIPTIIVINKIDRQGADTARVIEDLRNELKAPVFPLHYPVNEAKREAEISSIFEESDSETQQYLFDQGMESLSELDDEIMEAYLNGDIPESKVITSRLGKLSQLGKISPLFISVAKNSIGIKEILNGIADYFPSANNDKSNDLSALVFKIEHDKTLGRMAHLRMFGGSLKNRDTVFNYTQQCEEKISQIKKIYTSKNEDISELKAGDIGLVSGLSNIQIGNILGNPENIKQTKLLNIPVLTVQVKAENNAEYARLAEALQILNREDPKLNFKWYKEEQEMHINLMGNMQIEILQMLLESRFDLKTIFSEPTVIYKETPASIAEGYVRYTMPKPCWAILKFSIEPGKRGSGIQFESKVGVNDIVRKYHNEIERTIPKTLEQGIKGWEVTDIKITLTEGEDHEMHSRPGDFILATPMGIIRALEKSGTKLLEPVLSFEIKAPEEFLGSIASDLTTMRAEFANPEFKNGNFILCGKAPAATSSNYSIKLASTTGGKGKIKFSFSGYNECPNDQGQEREYKGVSPLNESKWILHARGAYKTNEWRL